MVFYTSVWACLIISLIIILHVLSVFLRGMLANVLSYVNIALHIGFIAVLLFIGAELSELVLLFMGSLLVRVVLVFIKERLMQKGSKLSREEDAP